MVDSDRALDGARAEAQQLAADSFWATAYAGAVPRLTVLVRNLTPKQRDYFLVDFQKNNKSTGRMIVNRDTGVVDVATGIENEGEELPDFIVPSDVRSRIKPEVILDDGRRIPTPAGTPTIVLLWQHCLESQSPLRPFYWIQWTGTGLFLRVDGAFFERLTPTDGMPHRLA